MSALQAQAPWTYMYSHCFFFTHTCSLLLINNISYSVTRVYRITDNPCLSLLGWVVASVRSILLIQIQVHMRYLVVFKPRSEAWRMHILAKLKMAMLLVYECLSVKCTTPIESELAVYGQIWTVFRGFYSHECEQLHVPLLICWMLLLWSGSQGSCFFQLRVHHRILPAGGNQLSSCCTSLMS